MKKQPHILVVDDQPINVKLLQRKLEKEEMLVTTAYSGRECLDCVKANRPDVILMDVMMPEMDGLEACQHLKANPDTKDIPVLFITAKTGRGEKIEGLKAGAADYITKPIDLDETMARVNTQLRIQENHQENIDLRDRLADMRHGAAVGAITQGIAHNLNNLLGVVVGYLDLLKAAPDNAAMVSRAGDHIDKAVKRMVTIVRQLTQLAIEEHLGRSIVKLPEIIEDTIQRYLRDYSKENTVVIVGEIPPVEFETNIETFEDMVGRVLINAWESYALENEAVEVPRTVELECSYSEEDEAIRIRIRDAGKGINEEVGDHMFEPFISGHSGVGRGMGLTVARHGARALGGDLVLKPREGQGVEATFTHPLKMGQFSL
ncbi:MAG: hybrid sensor histidine kinase/response regulator [Opitutales bacterium]|nr:hybrid sensor histidine kinase/response regulator [Opitutales bacterium]